jgi:glucokinase
MKKNTMVLAGDIGGSKAGLALYAGNRERFSATVFQTYPSPEAPGLEAILRQFLASHPVSVSSACFGIAGPVVNGRCKTTNLPWEVSENRLKQDFGWKKVSLINDLTATALSIPFLKARETAVLQRGRPRKGGNLALVAPGTGLGQGLAVFHQGQLIPVSSEGGHADFAPTSEDQVHLWRFLRQRHGHVSVERVLSGPGLVEVYGWVRDFTGIREPAWLKERFQREDPAKVITDCALEAEHHCCVQALHHFVGILGAVAGNLALTGLATGGVYLGGGIPPKILPALRAEVFMKAFTDKGRFESLLKKIPVRVILNDRAAMLGAAACAFQAAEERQMSGKSS